MSLNEEVDCNSSLDAPLLPEPAQCGHHLRCALHEGHEVVSGDIAGTIGQDHWAPHGGARQATEHSSARSASGVYWKSEASVDGVRMLPVDSLEQGQEMLELARLILADPHHNDHMLHMDGTGWTLKHPIGERVNDELFHCSFNPLSDLLSQEWEDDANEPGVYKVAIVGPLDDPRLWMQRIPADD
jgi:hypothetical protein